MTKTSKVQYSSRYTGRNYSEVPKIQMEGKWLEAIGFSVDPSSLSCRIRIRIKVSNSFSANF